MGTLGGKFPITDWSVVLRSKAQSTRTAEDALATLCENYWQPLYASLRQRGYPSADAEDLTQAFLASVVEKNRRRRILPERGRFRAFLMTALVNFAANEHHRAHAQKRGGSLTRIGGGLDDAEYLCAGEPAHHDTPERLFDRRWAVTLLKRVLGRLEQEYATSGKVELFRRLQTALAGDEGLRPHAETAAALRMSEGAVRVAAHRLRRRYRDLLRDEIGLTVSDPTAIDDEIRYLLTVVAARS